MPNPRWIKGCLVIISVLMIQGCRDDEQFTLVGEGGCRLADGGEGGPVHLAGLSSEQCQAECTAENGKCTAFEYNTNNGNCEVHSEPIVKFEAVAGVFCYLRN
jgi:PAN domain